ncbi:MAG TPA: sugar ABC transporter permease, partial [Gemmatimonadetes bacterium]|nr:sugar ABC transporter permease [Gemmatimonadota bacterium]
MRAEQKTASLMAGPYAAFLLVFAVYPIAFALVLVFLQWDLVTAPTFAGADNIRLLV